MSEIIDEKIRKDLIWINQSKVKRVTSAIICPQRYYLEEITGELQRYSSEAMLYGNYFEYHATGQLPRDGVVPIIPLLKKQRLGSYEPAVKQRLDQQILNFPKVMAQHGIKIAKTGYAMEYMFNNELVLHGILDVLVEYKGKPYILDIKMTGNIHNDYGDFAWGKVIEMHPDNSGVYIARFEPDNKDAMDFIQAQTYMYMMEKLTKNKWGFLYAVFDHKPNPEHKIIEVLEDSAARKDMLERMHGTKAKLTKFKDMNYMAIPSINECHGCKKADCSVRMKPEDLAPPQDTLPVQAKPVLIPIQESQPW